MADLSDTDRALIVALRRDSRLSVTALAQAAGVSRATAKTRLDALVESGRIRRFTIETEVEENGVIRAITQVELQGRMSRAVLKALHRIPEVANVWSTNGAWDLVIDIRADSLPNFDRVLREIREISGVLNSQTSLLLAQI